MAGSFDLDKAIRKVPDFPKPGILFYDITSVLMKPAAFRYCIDEMEKMYKNMHIDAVAAVEARGFLFAAPFCERMGIPLALIRKQGKLPGKTFRKTYQLEYGSDTIEIHSSDIPTGGNILLVDDLIATGGTMKAAAELVSLAGATVIGVFGVIGLPFLDYEKDLAGLDVRTLINYDSE